LSVLGVVIGVAAVIAMLSVSEGARAETLRQVERLGLNNIVVRDRGLTQADMDARRFHGLRAGDGNALQRLVPGVTR
jgi:putative ABC transport system permease protein